MIMILIQWTWAHMYMDPIRLEVIQTLSWLLGTRENHCNRVLLTDTGHIRII